jgi:hypothetical protein
MHHNTYRTTLTILAAAAALGACATGTKVMAGGDVAATTPSNANYLPAGTTMNARFDQSVSTASREGDAFSATVTDNVYAANGAIAVPAGSVLRGHVTGVHSGNIADQNVIRLNLESLDMHGRTYPFSGSVSNVTVKNGASSSTIRDATTGAVAGAVLGAVISGAELGRIVTGGLLGAAAGTVISLGTGDASSAMIPAGSTVTVRANTGVQVR